jgi:hypothetical protein
LADRVIELNDLKWPRGGSLLVQFGIEPVDYLIEQFAGFTEDEMLYCRSFFTRDTCRKLKIQQYVHSSATAPDDRIISI